MAWFMSFSVIIILIFIAGNTGYINRKTKISNLVTSLYDLHLDVQKDFNVTDAFLSYDVSNTRYYKTQESPYLDDHAIRIASIQAQVEDFSGSPLMNRMGITHAFDSLKTAFDHYTILFEQIVELTLEHGFKDYGIVGKMRDFAHELENHTELDQTFVLGLRRHEKDYIIRSEQQYVDKLNHLADNFRSMIEKDPKITKKNKEYIVATLENYVIEFNKMVELDRKIGLKSPQEGMKFQLDQLQNNIERQFNLIIGRAETRKLALFRYMELFYGLFFLLFLIINILLGRAIVRRISSPLATLTDHIKQLSDSNLTLEDNLEDQFSNYETSILYHEFRELIGQIRKERDELKHVQAALTENEEKYRQLAEHLPQCIFETDQYGNLTYVNSTWLKTLGYSKEDIREGLNIIQVIKADDGPITIGDESKGSAEYNAIRKDRSLFPALVYTNRINRDNRLIGFRGIIIDISDWTAQ